jgi:hypothetical protein
VATPPTFVQGAETAWSTSTTPKSSPSFDDLIADILVSLGGAADGGSTAVVPTLSGETFAALESVGTAATSARIDVRAATVASAGTGDVVSEALTGTANLFGANVLTFRGSDGVGAHVSTNGAAGGPSQVITTTQDNSAIAVITVDWNAVDGTTRTWRTVNGITPTAGNGLELSYFRDSINYAVYVAYYSDAGAAGAKTVGLSAPVGQKYTIAAIEIKGSTATAASAGTPQRSLPRSLGPKAVGPLFFAPFRSSADVVTLTALSGSDSATASETSDVQATVPGSDSSIASEAGTVSATLPGSDTGTESEAGTVSAAVPGSDSGATAEAGTASVTATGSDTGASSEAGIASVTASSSDTGTASDASQLTVIPPDGSDSGSGTEGGSVAMSGSGSDATAVTDAGLVAATVPGSDSATATDNGSVVDLGGLTPVSDSDSAAVTESGTVVDLTPPTPPVDTGGGGMIDETSIYGEFRALTGADMAVAYEFSVVTDLTVYEPQPVPGPKIKLPSKRSPLVVVGGEEYATASETAALWKSFATADGGRMSEAAVLQVFDPADEAEVEAMIARDLGMSGL